MTQHNKPFACYQCGACCYFLPIVPGYEHYKHDTKGHCKYLLQDNSCSIYEKRPDICRVDVQYKLQTTISSWDEYCEKSLKVCRKLEEIVYGKNNKKDSPG
jgi:Fe-S-cluster containining protein